MSILPPVRVGNPIQYAALTVFPLFHETKGEIDYQLSAEAIAAGTAVVEEVNEAGTVPYLQVENRSDTRILFLEGEELQGAKQNRILNTSLLVAAHSKTKIPVSCVEQGRWAYNSKSFAGSKSHSSSKLRAILKSSVAAGFREGKAHRSDQRAVWQEVERQMSAAGASSESMAMADTYEARGDRLEEFRQHLPFVPGASGQVIAVGGKIVAVDLFDKPATCEKVWDRLLTGAIMDALETSEGSPQIQPQDVERLLEGIRNASWQQTSAVGEGDEYRASTNETNHASALCFAGEVVHGSVVVVT